MSLPEDPKETLKTLIRDNITLYKDDEATPAAVVVCDEFNEEFWKKYDVIITVALANSNSQFLNLNGSVREVVANYRVGVWTRGTTGITGQKMRWKAVHEVTRIISDYRTNPGGILQWMKVGGVSDSDRTTVKPVLYHSAVIVETHRYETV